jgi:pimeloyl-ACP methyl ester carboxylesterase
MVETLKFFRTPVAAATNLRWLRWTDGDLPVGDIMAGPRRFPWCIPFGEPEARNAADQQHCFEALKRWTKPAHFIFGDSDPIFTAGWGAERASQVPEATFDTVPNASHFCQGDNGEAIVETFLQRQGAR